MSTTTVIITSIDLKINSLIDRLLWIKRIISKFCLRIYFWFFFRAVEPFFPFFNYQGTVLSVIGQLQGFLYHAVGSRFRVRQCVELVWNPISVSCCFFDRKKWMDESESSVGSVIKFQSMLFLISNIFFPFISICTLLFRRHHILMTNSLTTFHGRRLRRMTQLMSGCLRLVLFIILNSKL